MNEQTPPLLGGRYQLEAVIGRGGMAEVWRARDVRLGRDVAIKRLRVDLAGDPTFQARFRREAQAAAGLNHPNIVSVYDTGEETDRASGVAVPYIVMELVQGVTLKDVLRDDRRILPERALEFTQGVLDALSYSHRAGIVHRDIKPANVMLTPAGTVKVMDFGIARAVADTSATMTQTAAVIGTAQYLSPEQARGETVDARSDIYSAGVLLYELLTGRPPFVGDSPVSVAYQHVRETPATPSTLDPEITPPMDAVVMKALAKNPADRYQSAREMRDDISRILDGTPVQAPVPSLPEPQAPTAVTQVVNPQPETTARATTPATAAPQAPAPAAQAGRRASGGTIALVTLLAVLLGAVGYALWRHHQNDSSAKPAPTASASATPVAVPKVTGMASAAASAALVKAGFVPSMAATAGANDSTVGKVVSENPTAGSSLTPQSVVTLTVNSGPGNGTVPNVTGETRDAATRDLTAAGFTVKVVTDTTTAYSADHKGRVVAQSQTGTLAKGSTVTITMPSIGTSVPNLTQLSTSAARTMAAQSGYTIEIVDHVASSDAPGTIESQVPQAGSNLAWDTPIRVTVAKAASTPTSTATTPAPAPTSSDPTTTTPAPTQTSTSTSTSTP